MEVTLENKGGVWTMYIVPENDIDRAILKEMNGSTARHASDVKAQGSHIPDCLVLSKGQSPSGGS